MQSIWLRDKGEVDFDGVWIHREYIDLPDPPHQGEAMDLSKKPPRLFPLPGAPIDDTAFKLWRQGALAEVNRAVLAYHYEGEPYVPPTPFDNPRA